MSTTGMHGSRVRTRWRALAILAAVAVAATLGVVGGANPASAHAIGPYGIYSPAAGTWDRFSIAHPSYHHTPNGGDWGVDYYAAAGTSIYAKVFAPVPLANPTLRVMSVTTLCAGTRVKIEVFTGGTAVGWVSYSHLASVPGDVYAGAWISNSKYIGRTYQWPEKPGCWDVKTAAGVHTHIEAYNYHHYACYWPYGSNTNLPAGVKIGYVGSANAGPKQACPTSGWPYQNP